jgi:hypothetical protein
MTAAHVRHAGSPAGRICLALAASAGFHVLLTSSFSGLPEAAAGRRVPYQFTARLDLPSSESIRDPERAGAPIRPDDPVPAAFTKDSRIPSRSMAAAGVRRAPGWDSPLQESVVYAVHELDTLPRPVGPIDIGAPGTAGYRIELIIDEQGVVQRLALLDPSSAGSLEGRLRGALEATAFIPARKDGRAVRSRIVLQVSAASRDAGVP